MKSLFIIGNGFDLAHKLKTSYEDFHKYLQSEYPEANGEDYILPEGTQMHHGEVEYDDIEVVSFLLHLISNADEQGDEWSDLERALGCLDFDEYLDEVSQQVDKEGDPDYWGNMYNAQDASANFIVPIKQIHSLFSDWIHTIKINEDTPTRTDFAALANMDTDLFLTFNYTLTLEVLYQAKNVYHIHGKQGGKLIFGHGNDDDMTDINMSKHTGAEDSLQEIQFALRKDTDAAMEANKDFFKELTPSVNNIYASGFSFSEVDQIYIAVICEKLPTQNITWYLDDYNPSQHKEFKRIIRKCGFHGKFDTFHISENITYNFMGSKVATHI